MQLIQAGKPFPTSARPQSPNTDSGEQSNTPTMGCVVGKPCPPTVKGSSAGALRPVDCPAIGPASSTRMSRTTSGQGGNRFLDALTIALDQTSEGRWYASTLELQLASFEGCVACRGVRTLPVTVGRRMPLSLWGDDDTFGHPLRTTKRRRVPALRAAGVYWKVPIDMLVPELSEASLLKDVHWMKVVGIGCQYVTSKSTALPESSRRSLLPPFSRLVRSPGRIFKDMLTEHDGENHAIDSTPVPGSISWPHALRQLSLGCTPRVPINWEALPRSLERLAIGGYLAKRILSTSLPVTLSHLSLGGMFNQPIAGVVWPASLLTLTFGDWFDQPISGTDVVMPASLLQLTLGYSFNHPITGVVWPPLLPQLHFGNDFNQPIAGVAWPEALINLSFGDSFTQPIEGVLWPASLLRLSFGHNFRQPVEGVVWPAALHRLVFGNRFNQSITKAVWPLTLHTIVFSEDFSPHEQNAVWPASLWSTGLRDGHGNMRYTEPVPPSNEPMTYQGKSSWEDDTFDWPPRKDLFDDPKTIPADVWRRLARV